MYFMLLCEAVIAGILSGSNMRYFVLRLATSLLRADMEFWHRVG